MNALKSPWLTWLASLVLGCVFIYSSYHKIADPPDFAKSVYNYCIVPGVVLHLAAVYMPWFELIGGLAVATSIGRKGAALGFLLLVVFFIGALSFNLYRDHPTVCGCFGKFADAVDWTPELKFQKMYREIVLDVGLLLLSAQILYATMSPRPAASEDD